jgi:hypothetical protein
MNFKNRHIHYLTIFVFSLIFSNSFSQEVSYILDTKEIVGCQFGGTLSMKLQNNSNDTILIPLSPFKCEVIWSPYYWYSTFRSNTFTHNRITFLKKDMTYNEGSAYNSISYLKFPEILVIPPLSQTKLLLIFDESVKAVINGYDWEFNCEIMFAYRKDLNNLFNSDYKDYKDYKEEFDKALVDKEYVEINTVYDAFIIPDNPVDISKYKFQQRINDSTLYFYKDSVKYDFKYKSNYDKILSLFRNEIQ